MLLCCLLLLDLPLMISVSALLRPTAINVLTTGVFVHMSTVDEMHVKPVMPCANKANKQISFNVKVHCHITQCVTHTVHAEQTNVSELWWRLEQKCMDLRHWGVDLTIIQ